MRNKMRFETRQRMLELLSEFEQIAKSGKELTSLDGLGGCVFKSFIFNNEDSPITSLEGFAGVNLHKPERTQNHEL